MNLWKYSARFLSVVLFLFVCMASPLYALAGNVTYDGTAQQFIFTPGSNFSPTDLFTDFKDVMPGDKITQTITVKNTAPDNVRVKIYLRANIPAQETAYMDFLSQLDLQVLSSPGLFEIFRDKAANTGQLMDWVCLGEFASGQEVTLDAILSVPVEMDNSFQDMFGVIEWEFKVEEFPTGSGGGGGGYVPPTPTPRPPGSFFPPKTGDNSVWILYLLILGGGVLGLRLLLLKNRREKQNDFSQETENN